MLTAGKLTATYNQYTEEHSQASPSGRVLPPSLPTPHCFDTNGFALMWHLFTLTKDYCALTFRSHAPYFPNNITFSFVYISHNLLLGKSSMKKNAKWQFPDVPHPHNISVSFLLSCLLSFHIPLLFLTLLYFTHVTSPGSLSLADSSPSFSLSLFLHRLPRLHPYIHITFLHSLFPFFYLSPPSLYLFFFTFLLPTLFHIPLTSHFIISVPNLTQLSSLPLTASCTH